MRVSYRTYMVAERMSEMTMSALAEEVMQRRAVFEHVMPPGFTVTEEQRAEFDRARQTQASLSPIPSRTGDDDVSEGTMAMLRMMQRQMEMQMMMMKRMEERDEKRNEEEKEPKEKMKWRGVKLDIKHFSRVEVF